MTPKTTFRRFSPKEIKRACKNYMKADVLPTDRRLQQIVIDRLKINEEVESDSWRRP